MNDPPAPSSEELQFETADYASAAPAALKCAACQSQIAEQYYQASGQVFCGTCRTALEGWMTGGSRVRRFAKATLFGALAAALGAAIWYAIIALTGYQVGLVAIVVGLMVGGAVKRGSNGRGGWLYQCLAIFLTYASIASTFIPDIVQALVEHDRANQQTAATAGTESSDAAQGAALIESVDSSDEEEKRPTILGAILLIAAITCLAFAAPFLGGMTLIGWLIIGFALFEAWKINKRPVLDITGPFRVSASPPAPDAGDVGAMNG